jgi:hypothetical protein
VNLCNTIEENYREIDIGHLLNCLYCITIDNMVKMNIRWYSYTVQLNKLIIGDNLTGHKKTTHSLWFYITAGSSERTVLEF